MVVIRSNTAALICFRSRCRFDLCEGHTIAQSSHALQRQRPEDQSNAPHGHSWFCSRAQTPSAQGRTHGHGNVLQLEWTRHMSLIPRQWRSIVTKYFDISSECDCDEQPRAAHAKWPPDDDGYPIALDELSSLRPRCSEVSGSPTEIHLSFSDQKGFVLFRV